VPGNTFYFTQLYTRQWRDTPPVMKTLVAMKRQYKCLLGEFPGGVVAIDNNDRTPLLIAAERNLELSLIFSVSFVWIQKRISKFSVPIIKILFIR